MINEDYNNSRKQHPCTVVAPTAIPIRINVPQSSQMMNSRSAIYLVRSEHTNVFTFSCICNKIMDGSVGEFFTKYSTFSTQNVGFVALGYPKRVLSCVPMTECAKIPVITRSFEYFLVVKVNNFTFDFWSV